MTKKRWTESEESEAIALLKIGKTYKEISDSTGRSMSSLQKKNTREWKIDISQFNSSKLSVSVRKSAYKISEWQKAHGRWAGEKNPNYGAKIVKTGVDNPIYVWRKENPGYQDGEKNPSFGRVPSPEEIELKTRKIKEFSASRIGKALEESYGKEIAIKIKRAVSLSCIKRISEQKSSGTWPELEMIKFLDSMGITYVFQHPMEYYCVDFYVPDKNLVIQVDGCYWHGCPKHSTELDDRQKNRIRLDHSCDSYLKNRGYRVARIWECDIKKNNYESVVKLLTEEKIYADRT